MNWALQSCWHPVFLDKDKTFEIRHQFRGNACARHPLMLCYAKFASSALPAWLKVNKPSLQTLFVAFKGVKSTLARARILIVFSHFCKAHNAQIQSCWPSLPTRRGAHILLWPTERASRNISPISHRSDLLHFGISAAVCSHLRPGTLTAVLGAYLPH